MFEKLKQVLKMMTVVPVPFDPARFNDPLALQTEWTPAKRGGASFRNLARICEDAKTLAMFLGKPLWDATIT